MLDSKGKSISVVGLAPIGGEFNQTWTYDFGGRPVRRESTQLSSGVVVVVVVVVVS
jgi:hypothetical protein